MQLVVKLGLGTGHKVLGGGRGAMKIFFLSTGFQWLTRELFDKIGVAHPWSGTEKTSDPPPMKTSNVDVDRYIFREYWLTTFHLHCQLSANSL